MQQLKDKFLKFFQNPDWLINIADKIVTIFIIVILAGLIIKILLKITDYIMKPRQNGKLNIRFNEKKSETLHKLIKSLIKYSIYFLAFFQILSVLGINTTSIIASAGIASVAIGFGAQSLVKDLISGFFIVLEGQFDVGDYVKVYNQSSFIAEGNVLSLGVRSTKIRSNDGEIYFIPNGTINQVVNYSLMYNLAKVEFPILIKDSLESLENEIQALLTKLNVDENYTKYFYKSEKLIVNKIKTIEDNIASIVVSVKGKVTRSTTIENMLKKDFYNEFKDRITATK